MLNKVFVYGTLKAGMSNDRPIYKDNRKDVQEGTVEGTLFDLGHFPGLSLAGNTVIQGEVHTYPKELMEEIVGRMDSLEGFSPDAPEDHNFYNRRIVDILLKNGEKAKAYLYEFNIKRTGRDKIPMISSGVWQPKKR